MFRQFIQINAHHRLTQISRDLCDDTRILEVRGGTYDSPGAFQWITRLENARSDKDTVGSRTHHQGSISGSRTATCRKVHNRQLTLLSNLAHQFIWSAKIFCLGHQFFFWQHLQTANAIHNGAYMAHSLYDIARTSFTFRAYHRSTLANAAQHLTKITNATYKCASEHMVIAMEA